MSGNRFTRATSQERRDAEATRNALLPPSTLMQAVAGTADRRLFDALVWGSEGPPPVNRMPHVYPEDRRNNDGDGESDGSEMHRRRRICRRHDHEGDQPHSDLRADESWGDVAGGSAQRASLSQQRAAVDTPPGFGQDVPRHQSVFGRGRGPNAEAQQLSGVGPAQARVLGGRTQLPRQNQAGGGEERRRPNEDLSMVLTLRRRVVESRYEEEES